MSHENARFSELHPVLLMFRNVSFCLVTWYDQGFIHGPHNFFLWQNPKSLVQDQVLNPQAREIWCWYFFQNQYQTQVFKVGKCQSGVSTKNVNHIYVKGSWLLNSTFFWGRDASRQKGCSTQARNFTPRKWEVNWKAIKGLKNIIASGVPWLLPLCDNLPRISFPPESYPLENVFILMWAF